jgi:hypothetical protein
MNNENETKIIVNKKDHKMTRLNKHSYLFEYEIENKSILLGKIINLDFINIIHQINKEDIFEDFYLEKHSDNDATVFILFKHFFSDFGVPQKYAHLDVTLERTDNQIIYRITTNNNLPKSNLKTAAVLLPISDVTTVCNFINPHSASIKTMINFSKSMELPEFVEKLATTIISKIFLRTKQFIEKINTI